MAATTTMHFGPEWMRNKQPVSRTQPDPSPPSTVNASPAASTYSALVSPAVVSLPEKRDEAHPFRYSKEDLLKIYKDGGGKGGLGLEVERWEGVVREVGSEPIALRDMTEAEKKLFVGTLNSDMRRRQSSDLLSSLSTASHSGERLRSNHSNSATGSPLRERFGSLMRRRDGTDQPPITTQRKLSSSGTAPVLTPKDGGQPSPRPRIGFASSFDGVLSGGDSWASRRRTSDGYLRGAAMRGELGVGDAQTESKGSETIAEQQADPDEASGSGTPLAHLDSTSAFPHDTLKDDAHPQVVPPVIDGCLSTNESPSNLLNETDIETGPVYSDPDSTQDLASVEWSYLDPQGQVQGPFRADLMQKWYDEGYFIPELWMRRTNVDVDWISVADLIRGAGGGKIFLSHQTPPGLFPQPDSSPSSTGVSFDQNEPYHPAPQGALRTQALESYLGPGSSMSDSPTSSFGGGAYPIDSPDIASRQSGFDTNIAPRATGFIQVSDASALAGVRRNVYHDPVPDASQPIRTLNSYGVGSDYDTSLSSNWSAPSNAVGSQFDGMSTNRTLTDTSSFSASLDSSVISGSQGVYPGLESQEVLYSNDNTGPLHGADYVGGDLEHQHMPEDDPLPAKIDRNDLSNGPFASANQQYAAPAPVSYAAPPQPMQQPPGQYISPLSANAPVSPIVSARSPWATQDPTVFRRPDPFGPSHPTSANTIPNGQPAPPQHTWVRPNQATLPSSVTSDKPRWFVASQGMVDEGWKDTGRPNSLTFKNVGHHNQYQQALANKGESEVNADTVLDHSHQGATRESVPSPVLAPATSIPPAPGVAKSRRKSTAHVQGLASKPTPAPVQTPTSPSSPHLPTAPIKAAWLNEDETKKTKHSQTTLSLRDIQDAEAKKNEARKAVERERERQTRGAGAPAAGEELPAFTATWGLPTSQAGVSRVSTSHKDTPGAASSTASASAVWTNTGKAVSTKRSMKEIQEEEEQRKKIPLKETVAAAAAKRVYSESVTKPATPSTGGAWMTVGPSGRVPAAVIAPSRPPPPSIPPAPSVPSPPTRTNGTASTRTPMASSAAKSPPASTPPPAKSEEHPSPSHDFLKWVSESLKGLNNAVNVEEIISMLLSFPLDADTSTMEIISDLIYANSTTLDGRRFASEFVNKRKADAAASRQHGAGGSGGAKPVSIADVVKSQPKPAQPEWGGFKVVNKKKKGGRA